MITEDEMPGVCEKLDKLTLDCWHASSTAAKADAKAKYRFTWQAAWLAGFKITRRRIKDECGLLIGVKHSFKVRSAKPHGVDVNGKSFTVHCKNNIADLKLVDMRPEGFKTPQGYCTTNAMAQILPLSFEDIYKKQRSMHGRWNSPITFGKLLARYGYERIFLTKKLAGFKVAEKLFSIKEPFLAESAHHIFCIDNRGSKPCICDRWDSRRVRVESLYVKKSDAIRVKQILARVDL